MLIFLSGAVTGEFRSLLEDEIHNKLCAFGYRKSGIVRYYDSYGFLDTSSLYLNDL